MKILLIILLFPLSLNAQDISEKISEFNSYLNKIENNEEVTGGFSKNEVSGIFFYELKRINLSGIYVSKCAFKENEINNLYEYINDDHEFGLSLYLFEFKDKKCSYAKYDLENKFEKRTFSNQLNLDFKPNEIQKAYTLIREIFPNTKITEDKTSEKVLMK